ncbi:hypothetical protein SAMN06295905_1442 [Devosia lucknowensis]|uniref:Dolichyl-phosphate-mannose-protein mannosyltransferase n=1 Tax=Devosia lucknowensis TaxID=1096929 RepID=A0A1Y6EU92_9HYPH|nr:hypothetical protein [Devosia lucknowensis]SMQ66285.1 hypothetical protein SAMN06295905_1442 [Devosia lucknowensis]
MPELTGSKTAWFRDASPDRTDSPAQPSKADTVVAVAAVIIYAVLQVALVVTHDAWVDEAQAWLLATRLTNPLDLLILPGEGHPPLWHWLLRALSTVLDFNQARYLNTGVAVLNAILLYRLLRGEVMLLLLMLFSFAVLQYWGYHFRPYPLIFTCVISALLLDRAGRPLTSTWVLAMACGLHFFCGLFFAFWLVWQVSKGTPAVRLLAPAVVAALFGLSAVLSGLGNPTAGPETGELLTDTFHLLSWAVMLEPIRGPITAFIIVAALTLALRDRPVLLITLLALLVSFSVAAGLIYGRSPWHAAFQTMLCFIAFMAAGMNRWRRWVMIGLLAPQVAVGLVVVTQRLSEPAWAKDDLYSLVRADAGAGFDPETDLVGWPDMAIPEWAAENGIRMINGNNGQLADAIVWRDHEPDMVAPSVMARARPFWLICIKCGPVIQALKAEGATPVEIGEKTSIDFYDASAFRIE